MSSIIYPPTSFNINTIHQNKGSPGRHPKRSPSLTGSTARVTVGRARISRAQGLTVPPNRPRWSPWGGVPWGGFPPGGFPRGSHPPSVYPSSTSSAAKGRTPMPLLPTPPALATRPPRLLPSPRVAPRAAAGLGRGPGLGGGCGAGAGAGDPRHLGASIIHTVPAATKANRDRDQANRLA